MSFSPGDYLDRMRKRRPLVHNITNLVVMNYTANALLAMGASPVMAHSPDEVEEMVSLAGALVLNIGTLERSWVEAMVLGGKRANRHGIPVILDPVGAGATGYRTETASRLLDEIEIAVLRGNPSEILAFDNRGGARGVDAAHAVEESHQTARDLAARQNTVVAVTGTVDFITDGKAFLEVANGHPLMGRVTGTGCTATATVAAFAAGENNLLEAAAAALAYFGAAGELAAESASHPGSYGIALLDALDRVTPPILNRRARIRGG